MADDTGTQVAEMILRVGIDTTGKVISKSTELAGEGLKILLMKVEEDKLKLKRGKTNLEALINSGSDLKEIKVAQEDKTKLMKSAKENGIPIASIKTNDNDFKLVFRKEDIERVGNILSELVAEKTKNNFEKAEVPKPLKNIDEYSHSNKNILQEFKKDGVDLKEILIDKEQYKFVLPKIFESAKENGVKTAFIKADKNKQRIVFKASDELKIKNILNEISNDYKKLGKITAKSVVMSKAKRELER